MRKFHVNHAFLEDPKRYGKLLVYQLGTLYCDEKGGYGTHMHRNFFELTAVVGGKGQLFANDCGTAVKGGDVFVSFPFDTHRVVSDPADPLRYHFFAFQTTSETLGYQLGRIAEQFRAPGDRLFRDEEIFSALARAVYEMGGEEAFHAEYCAALLEGVLIRLIRHYYPGGKGFCKPGRDEMLVSSIMNYINTHIGTMKSLGELCGEFHYEYSTLSKLFSATASCTLAEYYRRQRMKTAQSLLHDGYSVGETAEALHYASVYSFSAAFRRQYGVSPMQYKKGTAGN